MCLDKMAALNDTAPMKPLFTLLLMPLFVGTSLANDLDEGSAAYQQKNYATAIEKFSAAAARGDAKAQYNLGVMHGQGQGTPQDFGRAERFFTQSAEQGFAQAQVALGLMFSEGRGVSRDDSQALTWYRKAAQQGNAWAQFALGSMYYAGRGAGNDHVRAHLWLSLAAQAGLSDAAHGRDLVAEGMSAEQLKLAQEMATTCQSKGLRTCH